MMLKLFKYFRASNYLKKIAEFFGSISVVDYDTDFLVTMQMYILAVTKISPEELEQLVRENLSQEAGGQMMGTLQTMLRKSEQRGEKRGRIKGIQEGIQEGRIKGIQEGIQVALKGIKVALEIKFGEQGLDAMKRLEKIRDLDKLYDVQELLKKAKTYQEFLEKLP
jgi:hypothetical protein